MAFIKIRGRNDPLRVADDLAKKIKERKFGVEGRVAKAEANELLEIVHSEGEWSGEYGRITEIDIQKREERAPDDSAKKAADEKRALEAWLAQTPEQKAQRDVFFEVAYCTRRLGQIKCEIPEADAKRAFDIRVAFYKANPTKDRMPLSEYPEDLVPPKGKSARGILAEGMRVDRSNDIF